MRGVLKSNEIDGNMEGPVFSEYLREGSERVACLVVQRMCLFLGFLLFIVADLLFAILSFCTAFFFVWCHHHFLCFSCQGRGVLLLDLLFFTSERIT